MGSKSPVVDASLFSYRLRRAHNLYAAILVRFARAGKPSGGHFVRGFPAAHDARWRTT